MRIYDETVPLYKLLNEINKAAQNDLPILASIMASTLPDICVSLEDPDGTRNEKKYKTWCEENLGKKFSYITGDDLYSFRCAGVHNGRMNRLKHNVSGFAFLVPAFGHIMGNKVNGTYLCGIGTFCENLTEAVFQCHKKNKSNPIIQRNMEEFVQLRDPSSLGMGFPPEVRLLAS